MTTTHGDGFRPSHFPALAACIHNQRIEGESSEAAQRGSDTHKRISEVIANTDSVNYESETPPVQFAAAWVIARIIEGWRIVGTEIPVELLDADGQVMTSGTLDLLLERKGEYQVVDWKTGDRNGYITQMAGYMSAVQDHYPKARVSGTIVYLDLQQTESITCSAQVAFDLVYQLWSKWNNKENEPYVINTHCTYCALRGECPAWRAEAAFALDTVAQLGIPTGRALVTAKIDAIKNDPGKLEQFVLAWERAETLVKEWKLKDALKTHMELGFKAEHHILVNVKDKTETARSIDPEQYLENVANVVGFANAAAAITVDPVKAVAIWEKWADTPIPVQINETTVDKSGYSYIRAKGNPGAGDARKKRKELE